MNQTPRCRRSMPNIMNTQTTRAPKLARLTAAILSAIPMIAAAQDAASAGAAVRYTPITGDSVPLYPSAGAATRGAEAPTLFSRSDAPAAQATAHLVVEVARDAIPADGQTPTRITVRVYDRDGKPATAATTVTVEASAGRIQLPGASTDETGPGRRDQDPRTPGTQVRVENGVAEFNLLAPFEPQDVRLRVTAGDEEAIGTVSFVPEMREWIGAGLIEGVVNFRHRTTIDTNRPYDGFEREIRSWERQFNNGKANVGARAAFFLRGVIKGEYLLTAAYDSDKDTRSRLQRDVDPDAFYPVYGDASIRGSDARSTDRLYVRIDKDKNYLLYGDFQTGSTAPMVGFAPGLGQSAPLALRSLGNYNRSATGLRAHGEDERGVLNAFVNRDSLRQVVQEFASQGSGPYAMRGGEAVEGTEQVEVITRDRNNPSLILDVKTLTVLADYTFEPFSGRLILTQPLPAYDANLNPISLRVSYEVDQGGEQYWVGGVDGQWRVGAGVEVGGSVVSDRNPLAQYELASANTGVRLGERTMLVIEAARSRTDTGASGSSTFNSPALQNHLGEAAGNAVRVEVHHAGERLDARLVAGRSDTEFYNPSAPFNAGQGAVKANASYALTPGVKAYAEAVRSEDRNTDGGVPISDQTGAQVGALVKLSDTVTLDAGVRHLRESEGKRRIATSPFSDASGLSGSVASGSSGGLAGWGNAQINTSTGLGGGTSLTDTALAAAQSTTARLGLGWHVAERWTVGAEVEQDIEGAERKRAALGADYQINDRTKLYGRFERQTGLGSLYGQTTDASAGNVLVAGVASTVWRDAQLYSEYRLRDAINGRDLQQAAGVRDTWDIAAGVRLGATLEQVHSLTDRAPDATAVGVSLDDVRNPLWRWSNKVEYRRSSDYLTSSADTTDDAFHTWLWQFMTAHKLNRDWTALGRNYLLRTVYSARGDILQDRVQFGLAYRDTDTNRINALAKYEYKIENDQSGLGVPTGATTASAFDERSHILSGHMDYHPSRPWWTTGRVAAKWTRGVYENAVADGYRGRLASGRIVYDMTEHWDIGVQASVFDDNASGRQYGAGIEVGYLLAQNLWLSAGFNMTGFSADRDLAGSEYTNRGAYLRLRFKFDEHLFSGDDRTVNRSLDR